MSDLLPLISTEENNEEIRTGTKWLNAIDLPPLPKKVFVVDPKTDEQLEEEDASNSVGYEEESDPKVESEQFMDPNHVKLQLIFSRYWSEFKKLSMINWLPILNLWN